MSKRGQPATQAQAATPEPAEARPLAYHERENPNRLDGEALRDLAHRRGLARSSLAAMSDEKIREQLLYTAYRRHEEAEA